MPKKQSSSRLSTIASRVLRQLKDTDGFIAYFEKVNAADIKALAASVLVQDEKKGNPKVTTIWLRPGKDFGWKVFEGRCQIAFSPNKVEAISIAKQQGARLKPSRVVLHVGRNKKILKEFK